MDTTQKDIIVILFITPKIKNSQTSSVFQYNRHEIQILLKDL